MNIHEYQAKQVLKGYGAPVADGVAVAGPFADAAGSFGLLRHDEVCTIALRQPMLTLRRILNKHLQVDSPYNTYLYPGLPPAPICTPSMPSIEAVLNGEKHNYLYFGK